MPAPFDSQQAYSFGASIEAAYRLFTRGVLTPDSAEALLPAGWHVVTELTGIDTVGRKSEPEFFGLVLQSDGDARVVIAIRGTDTLLEWLVDAEFSPCAFPGVPNAGRVEDGFCGVYSSLRCARTGALPLTLVQQFPRGTKLTVAGHSLGAAVATLLALDVTVNAPGAAPDLYTYASPKVGDGAFATFCSATVSSHFRIVNRPDIVPKLPPLYEPTGTEIDLDSTKFPEIAHKLSCYHTLTTSGSSISSRHSAWAAVRAKTLQAR